MTLLGLVQANNPQAMSNALWAYATLRYDPGTELMEAAAKQMLDKLEKFNPQVNILQIQSWLSCLWSCPEGNVRHVTALFSRSWD